MNREMESLHDANRELAELRQRVRELEDARANCAVLNEFEWLRNHLPLLITIAGVDGVYKQVNAALEGLLGWSEQELLSRPFMDFVHGDDRESTASQLAELAQENGAVKFKSRLKCKDGSYRWISWTVLLLAEKGFIYGIGEDITTRTKMEEELCRERNRAREYLEIAGVILVVLDVDGHVVLLNRRGHEILDYPDGALLGLDWFDTCVPPQDRDRVRAAFRELMDGNLEPAEYFENPILTRSGNERIIAWHNTLLFDESGRRTGTLSSGEDVTERRIAEQTLRLAHESLERRVAERTAELDCTNRRLNEEIEERRRTAAAFRQSHAELQAIYDSVADGLLVADVVTKRFVRANASMCKMLGYTESELLTRSVMDIHRSEDVASVLEKFEMLALRRIRIAENVAVRRKDGSIFFADVTAREITYRERSCLIGFFRDITPRRREAALRRQLEQEIIRVSEQERWRLGSELHDGLCQQLLAALLTWSAVENQLAMGRMPSPTELGLLKTMLEKSRDSAYDVAKGLCPTDLSPESLATALQRLACHTSEISGVACEFREEGETGIHDQQKTLHLYRIAQEAVTNTLKHAQARRIRLLLRGEKDTIVFQIQDDGSAGSSRSVQGGRMGLRIMAYRAEVMGGSVAVEHPAEGGTLVTCRVPRS